MSRGDGARTADLIRRHGTRLICARGYHAMNLRELADAVGIRAASLYKHFPSKQHLLTALLTEELEAMLAGIDAALTEVEGARPRLAAFARFHIEFHIAHRDATYICTAELRSLEPDNRARVVALRDAYQGRVEALVAACGVAEPKLVTFGLIDMLTGVCRWYREDGELTREGLAERYAAIALAVLDAEANRR